MAAFGRFSVETLLAVVCKSAVPPPPSFINIFTAIEYVDVCRITAPNTPALKRRRLFGHSHILII
ncbi:MAG: hypothetical protein ACK55Z_26170, partial [bacterium]